MLVEPASQGAPRPIPTGLQFLGPYNPNGAVHVTGGPQVGLVPNVAANVISRNKGRHLVQVYNYHPEAGLDYALTLTVAPPEASRR